MTEHGDQVHNNNVEALPALDKDRFEEQTIGGETGYFDKVEKLFISKRSFRTLMEELLPSRDSSSSQPELDLGIILEKSRSRVSRNLKLIGSLGKDSYSQ